MKIEWIDVEFHLEGCRSLKQKRALFRGARDRIGRRHSVAMAESRFHDSLRNAAWSFLLLAQNQRLIDQIFAEIERDLITLVDATIVRVERQRL